MNQTNQRTSWWAEFAKGPRRDDEFLLAAKRAMSPDPLGAPVIELGCLCTICLSSNPNIRDWRGYSLEAVKTTLGPNYGSIVNDKNGWRIFFCQPCAESWLFPYMERYVGYTTERILTEILAMTDKYVPGQVKTNLEANKDQNESTT